MSINDPTHISSFWNFVLTTLFVVSSSAKKVVRPATKTDLAIPFPNILVVRYNSKSQSFPLHRKYQQVASLKLVFVGRMFCTNRSTWSVRLIFVIHIHHHCSTNCFGGVLCWKTSRCFLITSR